MDDLPITDLINQHSIGFKSESQHVFNDVYFHLKKMARIQKLKIPNGQLDTTELVNDAWLKMSKKRSHFQNRNHYFAVCALAMKHILINESKKLAAKKINVMGSEQETVEVTEDLLIEAEWFLELGLLLNKLRRFSKRLEEVFTLKFFSQLTNKEIAALLEVTERTVERDWFKARTMISAAIE